MEIIVASELGFVSNGFREILYGIITPVASIANIVLAIFFLTGKNWSLKYIGMATILLVVLRNQLSIFFVVYAVIFCSPYLGYYVTRNKVSKNK